jgi:S-adenosylmethionine:tRNA ribosyltransferase-isomerase
MKLSDFDYPLPPELIAQHPLRVRDSSRLMVVDRAAGTVVHRIFHDLPDYIEPGDTLVFNDSRVIAARLKGTITGSDRQAEVLLLKQLCGDTWEALVRPGRKLMPGASVTLSKNDDAPALAVTAEIIERKENGVRTVKFSRPDALDTLGEMPLPPYIKARLEDRERYQTVYSEVKGSAAAPTAGLHFTPELLSGLRNKGVNLAFVTLHIGLDTFQPVRAEDPASHQIHTEYGRVGKETADLINSTKKKGNRVFAVGTTSVRLVEAASAGGETKPYAGPVSLYILPGYRFKTVDAVITNFHLPKSTLLMMISAFAGRELVLDCYEKAKESGYRFYSFGDAMLIL